MDELYALLVQHATCENADALWRLTRAAYEMGQHSKDGSEEKKKYMYEAFEHIKKAMTINDQHFAVHKVCVLYVHWRDLNTKFLSDQMSVGA
jgi:triphosphoribosyl-dephospho-CoA synthetase